MVYWILSNILTDPNSQIKNNTDRTQDLGFFIHNLTLRQKPKGVLRRKRRMIRQRESIRVTPLVLYLRVLSVMLLIHVQTVKLHPFSRLDRLYSVATPYPSINYKSLTDICGLLVTNNLVTNILVIKNVQPSDQRLSFHLKNFLFYYLFMFI